MKKFLLAAIVAMLPFAAIAEENGFYVGVGGGLNVSTEDGIDNQKGVNINIGYDFGDYRLEGDYDRLSNTNLQTNMFSVMGYREFVTATRFTPFIGLGLGYVDLGDKDAGVDNNDFAVIGSLGSLYKLNDVWSAVGQYRYIKSGADVSSTGGNTNNDSHLFTIGFRTKF